MAAAIACDLCNEEVAVMMQSNLATGDSQAVGYNCLLQHTLMMALAFADGITPEAGKAYRELVAAVATLIAPDLLMPEKPARAPRKGKTAAEPAADVSRETTAAGEGESITVTPSPEMRAAVLDAAGLPDELAASDPAGEMDGAGARIESASL